MSDVLELRGGAPVTHKKVAILGGGISALTTAFELSSQPDWQQSMDITIYQMGWRLGGKCATARGEHMRIEEHGIHGFLGSYYNALPVMRRCYEALGRAPGQPLATFDEAFKPESFVLMWEYIDGKILRKLMDNGPFEPKVAIHIALGILDALDESHRAGIIHRDIKPGNVMVTPTGLVKVCDFGIAQAIEDPTNDPSAIVGTAQYFSPEQAKGEIIDGRSDLYSTAVVLFEMVTGTPLFTGDTSVAVAFQHVTQTAPRARSRRPELSPELDVIIAKGLEKDRTLRFASAADFASALRGIKNLVGTGPAPRVDIMPESVESSVNRPAAAAPTPPQTSGKPPTLDLSEIRDSLDYGVIKMNIDTDTQYAFTRPVVDHIMKNYDGVLKIDGEIGNKKAYDPRAWGKAAEAGIAARVALACEDLRSTGTSLLK